MTENNVQLGELAYPFPGKILEKELGDAGIGFDKFQKRSGDRGSDSCVYYVNNKDIQKAIDVKEKIEIEDTTSRLRYRHPVVTVIGYLGCALFLIWCVVKLFSLW